MNINKILKSFAKTPVIGSLFLYFRHKKLQSKLKDTPLIYDIDLPEKETQFRTEDGSFNNIKCPFIGMKGQPFGRYMKPTEFDNHPCPKLVADTFFTRDVEKFIPGANLFVTAWLQFMIHDWFGHKLTNELTEYGVNKTLFLENTQYSINENSHFWDGSQIYKDSLRLKDGSGKLKMGDDGYLPLKDDKEDVGNGPNRWYGIMLLHLLFTKEHNYICDQLKSKFPHYNENMLYDTARLIITALIAKIHTIEWTPTILGNNITSKSQHLVYYGILGKKFKQKFNTGIPFLSGYIQGPFIDNGINFSHIEEFTSVYRMHSLFPENITIQNDIISLNDTILDKSKYINTKYDQSDLFYSLGKKQNTTLDLNNYPTFLRNVKIDNGNEIDLALIDIFRDRERCIPRYNQFRKNLLLSPITNWNDLTNDKDIIKNLETVYGNDVDKLDLLVGTHCEEKIDGSIFGETIYSIFLFHTTRRITNDRFLTTDFTKKNYTKWGIDYIENNTFKDVLSRHYPSLNKKIHANAFLLFD